LRTYTYILKIRELELFFIERLKSLDFLKNQDQIENSRINDLTVPLSILLRRIRHSCKQLNEVEYFMMAAKFPDCTLFYVIILICNT
jgi:hypothetical protein